MVRIGAVVCFSSDDEVFLNPLINSLHPICNKIIMTYADKYLDGKKQNKYINNRIKKKYKHPNIEFMKYEIDFDLQEKSMDSPNGISWKRYWIGLARKSAIFELSMQCDWILVLDSDELVDTNLFNQWINNIDHASLKNIDVINFDNYVYFWSPKYQAIEYDNSIIMVRPSIIDYENIIINEWERTAYHKFLPDNKKMVNVKSLPISGFKVSVVRYSSGIGSGVYMPLRWSVWALVMRLSSNFNSLI